MPLAKIEFISQRTPSSQYMPNTIIKEKRQSVKITPQTHLNTTTVIAKFEPYYDNNLKIGDKYPILEGQKVVATAEITDV